MKHVRVIQLMLIMLVFFGLGAILFLSSTMLEDEGGAKTPPFSIKVIEEHEYIVYKNVGIVHSESCDGYHRK